MAKLFIAGATGATGRVLVPEAERRGHDLVLHVRPQSKDKSPLGKDPRAAIFDLSDHAALTTALAGCDAVISLVGTMKKRFAAGDTYETSDLGSTRALVAAAKEAKVPRFLLLSSVGAGGTGAYLKMKGECERIVTDSGLGYTIFRPSVLVTPAQADTGHHGKRNDQPAMDMALRAVGVLPGLRGFSLDYRPIGIDVLVRSMLDTVERPKDSRIIMGRDMLEVG
jgi:uncharacterized protein YbjT (DUF2867 family)